METGTVPLSAQCTLSLCRLQHHMREGILSHKHLPVTSGESHEAWQDHKHCPQEDCSSSQVALRVFPSTVKYILNGL